MTSACGCFWTSLDGAGTSCISKKHVNEAALGSQSIWTCCLPSQMDVAHMCKPMPQTARAYALPAVKNQDSQQDCCSVHCCAYPDPSSCQPLSHGQNAKSSQSRKLLFIVTGLCTLTSEDIEHSSPLPKSISRVSALVGFKHANVIAGPWDMQRPAEMLAMDFSKYATGPSLSLMIILRITIHLMKSAHLGYVDKSVGD